ncbi:hypothetical protein [Methylibium sp.]|uniref:hypothetical protein n=1 Tax=Methylibium sp. TaxID=2067992 RepID=UPI003341B86F
MRQMIDNLYHALGAMPPWLAAVLIGWAVSAGVTQTVKFFMPLSVLPEQREPMTRLIAVLVAAVAAALAMIDREGGAVSVALVAVAAGVWSPLAFAMLQAALRRFWPWAADVLSGDVRGVIRGARQTGPETKE